MLFQFLGTYLLENGIISKYQLDEALSYQEEHTVRLGTLAVQAGLLTSDHVSAILKAQIDTDLIFGKLAVCKGLLSNKDIDHLLFHQKVNQVHLGEALLTLGHLSTDQLSAHLPKYLDAEEKRMDYLRKVLSRQSGHEIIPALIAALERAFLRFAHAPLKAFAEAADACVTSMPHSHSSEVSSPTGVRLCFTLYYGDDLLSLVNRNGSDKTGTGNNPHAVIDTIVKAACRYLGKTVGNAACMSGYCPDVASGDDAEPFRLMLGCPRALLGLSFRLLPPISEQSA